MKSKHTPKEIEILEAGHKALSKHKAELAASDCSAKVAELEKLRREDQFQAIQIRSLLGEMKTMITEIEIRLESITEP